MAAMTEFLQLAEPLRKRIFADIKTLVKALPKTNVGKVLKRELVEQHM
jgi:non-ribosomal peptide synthetase component E (peptide arylation enzyme)